MQQTFIQTNIKKSKSRQNC